MVDLSSNLLFAFSVSFVYILILSFFRYVQTKITFLQVRTEVWIIFDNDLIKLDVFVSWPNLFLVF